MPPSTASTTAAASSTCDREADAGADDVIDRDLDYDSIVSMAPTIDQQAVFIYRLAAPTTFGHADWATHNGTIDSIARIAEVPLQSVVTIHHLQGPRPDQPPRTTSVILQHVQDNVPYTSLCHC